jgi:hypothetical protein
MARRQFIFQTIPACALTCTFGNQLFGMSPGSDDQEKHMFDREFPVKLTYRKFIEGQNFQFIELAKAVQEKLGKEATLELIKELATEFNLERGRKQAENSPDRSLKSYTRMFADPKEWEGILRMEVVEDSEAAFELKVSECIQAANYIDHDAADIGHANVCWGDYAWAEGFNPKIKLVRDKTLMQGHSCCNHRYVWTG